MLADQTLGFQIVNRIMPGVIDPVDPAQIQNARNPAERRAGSTVNLQELGSGASIQNPADFQPEFSRIVMDEDAHGRIFVRCD